MTGKASWSQSKCHKGTGYLSRFSLSPLVSRFHFISFHKHYSLSHSSSFLIFSFFIGFEKKKTLKFSVLLWTFISFFLSEETNHERQCVELCSHTQYCFIFRCLLCSESGCLASWCLHFLHFLMVALCIEVCGFSFIFHFPLMGFTLFLKVFCFFLFGVYCLSNLVSFFFFVLFYG